MKPTEGLEKAEKVKKAYLSESADRWRYPRFFAPPDDEQGSVVITGKDAKHIFSVLRMRPGELAVVCDGDGTDYLCKIDIGNIDSIYLSILDKRRNMAEPDVEITLFQCVPKSDKMDFIVQKACELGASRIVPVLSERCVSRPDTSTARKKKERYEKIAEEAAKQCGRGKIPEIGEQISFSGALEYSAGGKGILLYERGGQPLRELAEPGIRKLAVYVGSEGGFTEREAALAQEKSVLLATLGERILRCETAPVAALAILMNITNNM